MIRPSSVFSRTERGSRFIEPRNTWRWSSTALFMCSALWLLPITPRRRRFALRLGLIS
jgi:hypothetical protein